MNKSEKEVVSKIIFVNSFKGGAGKTTLALFHCIHNLFHTEEYQNVVYMDLDILGTGTCYLFDEEKLPVEKCFSNTGEAVEIELGLDKEKRSLYVTFLSPYLKNRSSYGEAHFLYHQNVAEERLKKKVMDFINHTLKAEPKTLLVIDCAPGFSQFEQKILEECYQIAAKGKISVQEDYVTTLDSAHVEKCIQCLNDSQNSFKVMVTSRKINIILNDMQNYFKWLSDNGNTDENKEWEYFAKNIKNELLNKDANIYGWKYSSYIALRAVYKKGEKVENQVANYIFTSDNYKCIEMQGE